MPGRPSGEVLKLIEQYAVNQPLVQPLSHVHNIAEALIMKGFLKAGKDRLFAHILKFLAAPGLVQVPLELAQQALTRC